MTATVARLLAALALAVFALPLGSGLAAAHSGGLEPSPDLPRVLAVEPAVPGLGVTVVDAGSTLRVDNATAAAVTVPAAPGVPPTVVTPGTTARWPDSRLSAATWTITLDAGGVEVAVRGETLRPPPPVAGLWWAATALLAVVTTVLGVAALRRRAARVATALVAVVATASYGVHVLGSALALDGAPYWPTVLSTAGAVGIGAVVASLVGAGLALAGRQFGLLLCAVSGALLVLLTGADTAGFANAVLPFGWDPTLDRLTTAVTAGAGLGLFLTGFAVLRALTPETVEETS